MTRSRSAFIRLATGWVCLTAALLRGAPPLVTVGPVDDAPSVDGRLDDTAWQRAIVLSDFVRLDNGKPEPQRTQARMVRHGGALYVGVRCSEAVLEPRQQRSHEFRAAHASDTRDARVWHDDSIELFLTASAGSAPVYQFIVNSRGARFDGRDRDAGWDGDWQAAATTDTEGFFEIEIRLPFAMLGSTPRPGQTWRVQIGRNRKPAEAYHSAWPPAPDGFHEVDSFARLVFAGSAVGHVSYGGLADRLGVADAVIRSEGLAGGTAEIIARLPEGKVVGRLSQSLDAQGCRFGALRSLLSTRIDDAGTYLVSLTLTPPDGREPILVTPGLSWALGSLPASLTMHKRGEVLCEVVVNGTAVAATGGFGCRPGANVIAVRCKRAGDGTVRFDLRVDGRELDARGWRSSAVVPNWADPELDDQAWPVAGFDAGWLAFGERDEVILRRTVVVPTDGFCIPDNGPTHLARGAAQMLVFSLDGRADREDFHFEIELPSTVRLVDPIDPEAMPWLTAIGHTQRTTLAGRVRHRLDLSADGRNVDGFGGELRWCEREDGSNGLFYDRLLRFGGSGDWQRVAVRLTAPADAHGAQVWFLKWPRKGLHGLLEFDDLSLEDANTGEELLPHGDMEEAFKDHWLMGRAQRVRDETGNHIIRMHAKPEEDNRQLWFRARSIVPVVPDREYIYSCRARWQGITQPMSSKGLYPLVIEVDDDASVGPLSIAYGWTSKQGAITALDRTLSCLVGPAIEGRVPSDILLINWPSWGYKNPLGLLASGAQLEAMSDQWERCGFNVAQSVPRQKAFSWRLRRRFQMMDTISWHNAGRHLPGSISSFLKAHPGVQAMRMDGAPVVTRACPSYMLSDEGRAFLDIALEEVRREAGRYRHDILCTDYEVSISEPPTICFDRRCIDAFREFADLDAGIQLTPERILETYRAEWTDFHARLNAQLLRHIRDAVKEAVPEALYMVYSGYQSAYTKRHYGIDWALLQPVVDIGSAGYGRKPDWVASTVRALHPKPLVGGVLEYERSTRPRTLRTRVMRRLLDCRGGVMSWYGPEIDARWQRAFADASRVAAEWGQLIRNGRRADAVVRPSGDIEPDDVCVMEAGADRLIVVFNESASERKGRLDIVEPGGMPVLTEFATGRTLPNGSIDVDVEPWDYRVYVMSQR